MRRAVVIPMIDRLELAAVRFWDDIRGTERPVASRGLVDTDGPGARYTSVCSAISRASLTSTPR
jgi:hypothetical protein